MRISDLCSDLCASDLRKRCGFSSHRMCCWNYCIQKTESLCSIVCVWFCRKKCQERFPQQKKDSTHERFNLESRRQPDGASPCNRPRNQRCATDHCRSEERRVGKGVSSRCRARW